jgi:hypothetical protein
MVMMKTIDDVLDYLAGCVERADGGTLPVGYGIFARAYHRFTLSLSAYSASGVFEDPAWIADFDVRFARCYARAVDGPGRRPQPWDVAMRSAERSPRRAVRHLMLGINAHMRYDLCCVLLEGVVDDRERRLRDFVAVNGVIARAVDSVQRSIEDHYGDGLRLLDVVGLHLDELLTEKRFASWRNTAWEDAMSILDGSKTLGDVEREVTHKAKQLALLPL